MEPKLNKINSVEMKQAETKEEKMLLGFIDQEAKRIGYGKIVVEFTIRNGEIVHINSNEVTRSFNFGKT